MNPDPRAPGMLVGEGVQIGDGASIGPYAILHDGVSVGAGASIGAHAVIHAGTIVGDRCVIEDHVVLGKPPRLARSSSARGLASELPPLRLGAEVTVCASAVVFAGASIEEQAIVGDHAYVRERASVGPSTVIGHGSVVDNDVTIGARVKVQTGVYLTAFSVVEDDVFLGPGATSTNDDTMSRHGPDTPLRGATLRRACRIGGGAVLTPGVEVGEEAFLAAGAVLTRDLPPRAVAIGVPARVVREVGEQDLLGRWRQPLGGRRPPTEPVPTPPALGRRARHIKRKRAPGFSGTVPNQDQVQSRLGSDSEAHDAEAHDAEAHDAEAHDAEAHDAEAHDAEAHDAEAHDAEAHDAEAHDAEAHDVDPSEPGV
ncbi:MAG: DapH/DapD/GlmU-related protein [Solirubrobacteraceae bacterium]